MQPAPFKEANVILKKPDDMTDEECGPLPICRDEKQQISLWKPSFKERWSILFNGKVWLGIVGTGNFHPPVWLWGTKTPFEKGDAGNGKSKK